MPRTVTRRRNGAGLASEGLAVLSKGSIAAAVVLATAGLVYLSTFGATATLLAIGVAAYCLLLAVIGIRHTATLTLMAAFVTAPAYKGLASSPAATITPTDVLLVLGLLVLAPTVLTQRVRLPGTYLVGVGVLAVMGLVASALAEQSSRSFLDLVQMMMVVAILPFAVALWHPSTRVVELLAASYVGGHIVSTGYALATGPIEGGDRYAGLAHHPNAFGEAGMMAFALLLFLYHRYRSRRLARVLVVGALVISAVSVVQSGSRAAVIVVAALVLLIPVVERSAVSGFLLAAGGGLMIAMLPSLLAVSGEGSALTRLAGTGDSEFADNERRSALDAGIARFFEQPVLGSGFADVEFIHNVFLEIAVATGVVGLAGFLLVMWSLARPLIHGGDLARLSYAVLAYIGLGWTVPGLQDRTLWVPVVLAVLAAVELQDRLAGRAPDEPAPDAAPMAPGVR